MPEINCNADVLSIQNDADASQDDDAVNASSRRRCAYTYTLKAITIQSLRNELQHTQHYILFAAF